ncbi:MAG: hypothetical protein AB1801_25900, partial [Chloroflexota bacterium]
MDVDPTLNTTIMVKTLIGGREADRFAVQRVLEEKPHNIDLEEFCRQLLAELKNSLPDVDDEEAPNILARSSKAYTRSWIISSLGRISNDCPQAVEVVKRHLDPACEPDHSIRGWALASLIVAGAADVVDLARPMLERE